jgi:hypothetical protein
MRRSHGAGTPRQAPLAPRSHGTNRERPHQQDRRGTHVGDPAHVRRGAPARLASHPRDRGHRHGLRTVRSRPGGCGGFPVGRLPACRIAARCACLLARQPPAPLRAAARAGSAVVRLDRRFGGLAGLDGRSHRRTAASGPRRTRPDGPAQPDRHGPLRPPRLATLGSGRDRPAHDRRDTSTHHQPAPASRPFDVAARRGRRRAP